MAHWLNFYFLCTNNVKIYPAIWASRWIIIWVIRAIIPEILISIHFFFPLRINFPQHGVSISIRNICMYLNGVLALKWLRRKTEVQNFYILQVLAIYGRRRRDQKNLVTEKCFHLCRFLLVRVIFFILICWLSIERCVSFSLLLQLLLIFFFWYN